MLKIKIKDYESEKYIEFNNNAKGIRDFVILLNKIFKKNEVGVRINASYKK